MKKILTIKKGTMMYLELKNGTVATANITAVDEGRESEAGNTYFPIEWQAYNPDTDELETYTQIPGLLFKVDEEGFLEPTRGTLHLFQIAGYDFDDLDDVIEAEILEPIFKDAQAQIYIVNDEWEGNEFVRVKWVLDRLVNLEPDPNGYTPGLFANAKVISARKEKGKSTYFPIEWLVTEGVYEGLVVKDIISLHPKMRGTKTTANLRAMGYTGKVNDAMKPDALMHLEATIKIGIDDRDADTYPPRNKVMWIGEKGKGQKERKPAQNRRLRKAS